MANLAASPVLEKERIAALNRYGVLDSGSESNFDHILQLTAHLFEAPIALITFVDEHRVWIKSSVGTELTEIDRHLSLCSRAIEQDDCFVVENVLEDPTLSGNEMASQYGLIFYAGVPLKVRSGHKLGTLCILDKRPRKLDAVQRATLKQLATLVVDQLELKLVVQQTAVKQQHILSMLAHELKNPLSIIPTTAEVLKEELADSRQDLVLFVKHVERAGQRMTHLINDILEIGKLQADEIYLNRTSVNLTSLMARITGAGLVLANAKQQRIMLDIKEDLVLHADETKLGEIFENLLSNCIKYSAPEKNIEVQVSRDDTHVIIYFVDEGPGFEEADFKKMYEPFTRLSARPTAGENSTGIGLSIVKMLTEAHGGSITIQNNNNSCGAIATVKLPLGDLY